MSVNWEPIDEAARHLTRPTPNWFDEPSIGQRFLGTVIDGLLLAPLMVAVFVWEGIAVSLAVTAIRAAYEILLVTHTGQTVGKMAMRTRVVDATTGDLIDLRRSAIRWFGRRTTCPRR